MDHDTHAMLTDNEQRLLATVQNGFPLCSNPYAAIGQTIGQSEAWVLTTLQHLQTRGVIRRIGIVVQHHQLGYRANAMAVWNIPDAQVMQIGENVRRMTFVTLCYVRKRSLPDWPYNFYCMIHGQQREETLQRLDLLVSSCGLTGFDRQILFSKRQFKQCGARYFT
ncbi:MAG: hypothetical protein H7832_04385 [Magnetococcus sp. DMHC-6]